MRAFVLLLLVAAASPALADSAALHFSRAAQRYDSADFDGALSELRAAVKADPNHLASLHLLGVVQMQTGAFADGEQTLKDSLARGGSAVFPQTMFELGLSQFKQLKYQDALASLHEAVRLEPRRAAAFYLLGMTQYELHDYATSAETFRLAASNVKHDELLYVASMYYRGEALLRSGDDADARRAFATVKRDGAGTVFADVASRGGTLQGESGEGGAYVALGIQYDTNVALVALGTALPAVVKQDGGRGIVDAGIRYTTPIAGPVDFGFGIFFYQSLHFTGGGTENFNLTAPWGNAEFGFRFSDKPIQDRLSFGYTGGADFIRGDSNVTGNHQILNFYEGWHHPYARFELREGRSLYTSFTYTLRLESFYRPTLGWTDPRNSRTNLGHEGRVAQYYELPKKLGRIGGGVFFQYQDANGDRWDNLGGGAYLEAEVVIAKKLGFRVRGDLSALGYPHDDRQASRLDANLGGSFGIRYWFIESVGIHGDIGYARNFSNFAPFAYDRAIFSFYLMARY